MRHERRGCIQPDHPALAGHFPGNPLVPGVVLLTEIAHALTQLYAWLDERIEIQTMKFLQPLRPAQPFTIIMEPRSDHEIAVTVWRDEVRIAAGLFRQPGLRTGELPQ